MSATRVRNRGLIRLPAAGLALVLLIGCAAGGPGPGSTPSGSIASASPVAPSPLPSPVLERTTVVHFTTSDGVRLEGRRFGTGPTVVVLSHQLDNDQSAWFGFATLLDSRGYSALTYDFRGYCPGGDAGCSKGIRNPDDTWKDVLAAADYARRHGARRIVLMGASMGGEASIIAAGRSHDPVAALVTLSASKAFVGLRSDEELRAIVRAIDAPKLFIAGENDTAFARAAEDYASWAGTTDTLRLFPVGDHGTDLVNRSDRAPEVVDTVLTFLAANAPP